VIDEMESDLHPMLLEPILELFDKQSTNPNGAQILFTCHSSKVLELLQKPQVTFVEKNMCESEAFRGDDVDGLRSDDNLRSKYESGAIGAIPQL
jgi:predicted ATPase